MVAKMICLHLTLKTCVLCMIPTGETFYNLMILKDIILIDEK